MAKAAYEEIGDAHAELKESMGAPPPTGEHELDRTMSREPRTTMPEDTLRSLGEQLLRVPEGFEVHRKLKPFLDKRRKPPSTTPTAGSTGPTRRRSRSHRCWRWACPCG